MVTKLNLIYYEQNQTQDNNKRNHVSFNLPKLEIHKQEQNEKVKNYTNNKLLIHYETKEKTKTLKENIYKENKETLDKNFKYFSDLFQNLINFKKNPLKNSQQIYSIENTINKLSKEETLKAIEYLKNNGEKAIDITNLYNYCPESGSNLEKILNVSKEIKYDNEIEKFGLSKFEYNGQTATDFLKDKIDGDYCVQTTIKGLDNFVDKEGKHIDEKKLIKIIQGYIKISEEKNTYELSAIIKPEGIELLKKTYDKKQLIKIIQQYKLKELNKEEIESILKKVDNLGRSNKTKKIGVEKTIELSRLAKNNKDFQKLMDNEENLRLVEKFLKNNEEKFLKLINKLNIYDTYQTDILVILRSRKAYYILNEIDKYGELNNDGKELLAILKGYFKIEETQKKEIYEIKVEKKENEKIKKEQLDNLQKLDNQTYNLKEIPEKNPDGDTILKINDKNILISPEEYKLLITEKNGERKIKDPEALKNFVNFKEKMEMLSLGFVRKYRTELIGLMKNKYPGKEMNLNEGYIDNSELNNLLGFVLEIIGSRGDNMNLNSTFATIIDLNQVSYTNNKKDTKSGLSNIGLGFIKAGFLNSDGGLQTNWKANINLLFQNK